MLGRIGAERPGLGGAEAENTGFGGEGTDSTTFSPGSGPDLSSWIGLQMRVDARFTLLRVGSKVCEDSADLGADMEGEWDTSVEVDLIAEEVSEEKDDKEDDDDAVGSMDEPNLENLKNINRKIFSFYPSLKVALSESVQHVLYMQSVILSGLDYPATVESTRPV